VVSCTIGILAALAALGDGQGRTTGSKGALRELHEQPFGQVLLAIVGVGLFGYALWLFVQAALDPEHTARRSKHPALLRVGRFFDGFVHVGLGVYAFGLVTGVALGSDEDGVKSWTARLLGLDGIGRLLVAVVGAVVIGRGVLDLWKAAKARLDQELDLSSLPANRRKATVDICRFGLASRAVVFALIGAFLVMAAARTRAADAEGLGGTLRTIQGWSYGWALLAVVALGFVAYGVYQVVLARYRRVRIA
jgi:hypothetical protein